MEGVSFTLPTGILQQDIDVIDEQEHHIVLTVRVPIELIRKNHSILAGLSEIATGESRPPPKPLPDPPVAAKPVRKRKPHWIYGALIFIGFLLPSPFFAFGLAKQGPPVEYETVKLAKPTFKVGEDIEIVFRYLRDRFCLTTFDRVIGSHLEAVPMFTQRYYGVSSTLTHGEFRDFHLSIHPPTPLPPGDYYYSGLTHSDCAQGGAYDLQHPTLWFSVVE